MLYDQVHVFLISKLLCSHSVYSAEQLNRHEHLIYALRTAPHVVRAGVLAIHNILEDTDLPAARPDVPAVLLGRVDQEDRHTVGQQVLLQALVPERPCLREAAAPFSSRS